MFTRKEQRTLHALATTLRRLAGHLDAVTHIPSGVESSVLDILDDVHATLLEQADAVRLLKESVKARQL